METQLTSLSLTEAQFDNISKQVYDLCGINLHSGKEELVRSRLFKRLRALGLVSFDSYINYVKNDASGIELSTMVDYLTTNKTSFFRESHHFEFLHRVVVPAIKSSRDGFRIWSAGCSSGQEPYSIAMQLRDEIPEINKLDVRILATDISARMLSKVKDAVYEESVLGDVPQDYVRKYFTCIQSKPSRVYRVVDDVRSMVRPARLNLMEEWPMKGKFDIIFCRNVMIYFDKPTQTTLVHRYWQMLKPGGYLLVGHSESLTAITTELKYKEPAVYAKVCN